MRGKDKLHLKTDPPPDLAIEAVHSHDADAAIEVYRRFKVPEVWVCDEDALRHPGSSTERTICRVFHECILPVPRGGRGVRWVRKPQTEPDTTWVKQLRTWVKRTLKPRVRRQDQQWWSRTKSNNVRPDVVR